MAGLLIKKDNRPPLKQKDTLERQRKRVISVPESKWKRRGILAKGFRLPETFLTFHLRTEPHGPIESEPKPELRFFVARKAQIQVSKFKQA